MKERQNPCESIYACVKCALLNIYITDQLLI